MENTEKTDRLLRAGSEKDFSENVVANIPNIGTCEIVLTFCKDTS
jgi:hypothetical protein